MQVQKLKLDESLFDDDFDWEDYKDITNDKPAIEGFPYDHFKGNTQDNVSCIVTSNTDYEDIDDTFEMTPEQCANLERAFKDSSQESPNIPTPKLEKIAIETMINNAIQNMFQQIDNSNAISTELQAMGKDSYVQIIQNILTDLNNNVGQLQTILKDIAPNAKQIDKGESEAQQIVATMSTNGKDEIDISADSSFEYDDEI